MRILLVVALLVLAVLFAVPAPAGAIAAAVIVLTAGAWYARRRWLG